MPNQESIREKVRKELEKMLWGCCMLCEKEDKTPQEPIETALNEILSLATKPLDENKILDMLEGYELNIERSKTNSERRRYRLELAQKLPHFSKPSVPSVEEIQNFLTECVHLGTCIYDKDCHENKDMAVAIHNLITKGE